MPQAFLSENLLCFQLKGKSILKKLHCTKVALTMHPVPSLFLLATTTTARN
jgi:hypothetical protein